MSKSTQTLTIKHNIGDSKDKREIHDNDSIRTYSNLITSLKPYFQIQLHSEGLGVKASTYEF